MIFLQFLFSKVGLCNDDDVYSLLTDERLHLSAVNET